MTPSSEVCTLFLLCGLTSCIFYLPYRWARGEIFLSVRFFVVFVVSFLFFFFSEICRAKIWDIFIFFCEVSGYFFVCFRGIKKTKRKNLMFHMAFFFFRKSGGQNKRRLSFVFLVCSSFSEMWGKNLGHFFLFFRKYMYFSDLFLSKSGKRQHQQGGGGQGDVPHGWPGHHDAPH